MPTTVVEDASSGRRRREVLTGVSVAAVLVPQSLAYAELAGLPPGRGLVAAAAAAPVAALLGSSTQLQTGPTALASLLTVGALAGVASGAPPARLAALAALLAVLVGLVRLALGVLRTGWIASLLSRPVVTGLTTGAGVLIVASQVPGLLGATTTASNPVVALGDVVGEVPSAWPALVAAAALTTMLVLRRVAPRVPAAIVALGVGWLVTAIAPPGRVATLDLAAGGIGIDVGLLDAGDVVGLLVPAIVLAVIGFSEVVAIARRYATADRTHWDADRELASQGMACLAAGVVGGLPVSGSFSRSALLRLGGARTRLAAVVAGLVALAALPLAPALPGIPRPALAAVVVVAGWSLLDVGGLRYLRRTASLQLLVAVGTLGAAVVLAPRVDLAVLVGVALAVGAHLFREEHLRFTAAVAGDTLELAVHGVVFFVSVPRLSQEAADLVAAHPSVARIRLDLGGAGRVDASGALALADLVELWQEAGLHVELVDVSPTAERIVTRVVRPTVDTPGRVPRA